MCFSMCFCHISPTQFIPQAVIYTASTGASCNRHSAQKQHILVTSCLSLLMLISRAFSSAVEPATTAKQLYRELLKQIKQLPQKTQLYYRNYTRQYFANWNTESDPEVIQQLHSKARQDAQWILSKYSKSS